MPIECISITHFGAITSALRSLYRNFIIILCVYESVCVCVTFWRALFVEVLAIHISVYYIDHFNHKNT